jgi:hypothetical protein
VPFDKLGFPTLGPEAIPRYANVAMAAVPPTIVVVSAAMAGIYWITKRREQMMSQKVSVPVEQWPKPDQDKED